MRTLEFNFSFQIQVKTKVQNEKNDNNSKKTKVFSACKQMGLKFRNPRKYLRELFTIYIK